MFDWVFAVFVMFWMLGQDTDRAKLGTEDHPPPSMRAVFAMSRVQGKLRKDANREEQNRFDRARFRAFQEASDAINIISAGRFVPQLDKYLWMQEAGILTAHLKHLMGV